MKINEVNIEKIESFGHWGKPLIWKNTVGTNTGFEMGVSEYQCTEFPQCKTHNCEEALYFISGEGAVLIGEKIITVKTGDAIYIPSNTPHAVKRIKGVLKAVYAHSGQE